MLKISYHLKLPFFNVAPYSLITQLASECHEIVCLSSFLWRMVYINKNAGHKYIIFSGTTRTEREREREREIRQQFKSNNSCDMIQNVPNGCFSIL